jgi:hypothetical protein
MTYVRRFDIEDRQGLLALLETISQVAARQESVLRLLGNLALTMTDICGDAELVVEDNFVSFLAIDHCRYYASVAGLWLWDGKRGVLVVPHKWWLAALQTRVYWMRLHRRAPEVAARSVRFELKGGA